MTAGDPRRGSAYALIDVSLTKFNCASQPSRSWIAGKVASFNRGPPRLTLDKVRYLYFDYIGILARTVYYSIETL